MAKVATLSRHILPAFAMIFFGQAILRQKPHSLFLCRCRQRHPVSTNIILECFKDFSFLKVFKIAKPIVVVRAIAAFHSKRKLRGLSPGKQVHPAVSGAAKAAVNSR
jgi:hypothetical protein